MLKEMGITVSRGDKIKIKILLDGKEYDAVLTYNLFKEQKYPDHSDILQICYKTNGTLSQALQKIPDAIKFGRGWAIPANSKKPRDGRVTTDKYRNWRKNSEKGAE